MSTQQTLGRDAPEDDESQPDLLPGDIVSDREAVNRRAMVARVTDGIAETYRYEYAKTVHDANPQYPAKDRVIEVVFLDSVSGDLENVIGDEERYAYPRSRLELVASVNGGESL